MCIRDRVVVTDNRTDAEKYTPEFNQIEKNHGEATTEEEIKGADVYKRQIQVY